MKIARYIYILDRQDGQWKSIPTATALSYLPHFYRIDQDISLVNQPAYQANKVMGIDAASGIVVKCLQHQPDHHILDLCCATGGKLLLLQDGITTGSVTGIDASLPRLFTTRNRLIRYRSASTRIYHLDGSKGNLIPFPSIESLSGEVYKYDKGWWNRRHRRAKKGGCYTHGIPPQCIFSAPLSFATLTTPLTISYSLYDRVLIDAPCTLDASTTHIALDKSGYDAEGNPLTANLHQVQIQLCESGYRSLKEGGIMVYATCSYDPLQNEDIMKRFLGQHPNMVPIDILECFPDLPLTPSKEMEGCYYLYPSISHTSGMFISAMVKHSAVESDSHSNSKKNETRSTEEGHAEGLPFQDGIYDGKYG